MNGSANPEGMPYVLVVIKEYRSYAIQFLRDIKPVIGRDLEPVLDKAIHCYQESYENIRNASDIFPVTYSYQESFINLRNEEKRIKAEFKGIALLNEILVNL